MITFDVISKMVREERNSTKLVSLPESFVDDVKGYLSNKEKMEKDNLEFNTAKSELKSLFEMRELKIINMAHYFVRSGIIPGNMLPEERAFFNKIVNGIKDFQTTKKNMIEGEKERMQLISFLEDVQEFVGIDMKNYGPFKAGDVANIPEQNSKLLLEKGLVKKINTDSPKK